jgi:hypothetical protein
MLSAQVGLDVSFVLYIIADSPVHLWVPVCSLKWKLLVDTMHSPSQCRKKSRLQVAIMSVFASHNKKSLPVLIKKNMLRKREARALLTRDSHLCLLKSQNKNACVLCGPRFYLLCCGRGLW